MTAKWAESKSPSFQLAGNLCEAHSTEVREKTSFTEDSSPGQQNSESSRNQHKKRGRNNRYIVSVQSGFPSFQCDFASRQNLFCLMPFRQLDLKQCLSRLGFLSPSAICPHPSSADESMPQSLFKCGDLCGCSSCSLSWCR